MLRRCPHQRIAVPAAILARSPPPPRRAALMPLREIIAKSVGFGLTAATSVIGGILLLIYPHAYNDYVQFWLALFLIVLGVGIGGVGGLLVFGIIADARLQEREEQIHVTPRPGPYAPPPAFR